MITDQYGAVTSRKDFSAFGEETVTQERTQPLKYQPSNIRQDYTGYEKDGESGLEFAQARYYNPTHGRFTSVDPLTASASILNPQTFNRYTYVLNSPYKFVDPLGLISVSTGACAERCPSNEQNLNVGGGGGEHLGDDRQSGSEPTPPPNPQDNRVVNDPKAISYDVNGRTASDAAADAERQAKDGKTDSGRAGSTKLIDARESYPGGANDLKLAATPNKENGGWELSIEIVNVTVTVTIETTLPKWVQRNDARSEEKTKWDKRLAALSDHEGLHTSDIMKRAGEYRKSLIGLKATGTGSTMEAAYANAIKALQSLIIPKKLELIKQTNADGRARDKRGNDF